MGQMSVCCRTLPSGDETLFSKQIYFSERDLDNLYSHSNKYKKFCSMCKINVSSIMETLIYLYLSICLFDIKHSQLQIFIKPHFCYLLGFSCYNSALQSKRIKQAASLSMRLVECTMTSWMGHQPITEPTEIDTDRLTFTPKGRLECPVHLTCML